MTTLDAYGYDTHEVLNQAPALADYDAFTADPALGSILDTFGAGWFREQASVVGGHVGSQAVQDLARQANRNLPELRTHDRWGRRVDQIEFHPAWHELMRLAMRDEFHSLCWTQPQAGAQVARAAVSYLWNQGENGICCPLGMTYSAIPVLQRDSARWAEFGRLITSTDYDGRPLPAVQKRGGTVGMAMTEKQGGSDLRQTQTVATRNADGTYSLTGHKWFFSVPHSDVFLTLARTEEGVSCFVVPGGLPDGSRNRLQIQRLKDKCGNKSNASSEVEFRGVIAHLIGEPGHGIRAGLEMNHYTRLDFAVGSAGLMRHAVAQAAHHTAHRRAFQKALIDQPIMTNVIADLALEAEASAWLAFRFVHALDREGGSEAEKLIGRIGAPIAKYWNCKRATPVVVEALECHGGNGFIEDHLMARLYREAPLNGIWEGTGNVVCLDVLRSIRRYPDCVPALLDELRAARGSDPRYDAFLVGLEVDLVDVLRHEHLARRFVERMALGLAASLLIRHAPPAVADAYVASRLAGGWSGHFGSLPQGADLQAIARRAVPVPE
ncbi:acyl-CoA dehydrogenase family protein [Bosea sp. (in: a-proteobacteria)]|uniref:acyl-CoA dehydrogenase family protein n=1 Tax=Bosea sp. (in: a-proteobacteria) TaxID=1871050 RepID=UPI001AC8D320|nr:acyl-CoA dehydrogenase family protein [Bosea sp. (in: a-proteobacteria)]MBN9442395.1 acyl-CoA dehydrogenase family protein [Bosea sp. (in: a-proteobacteria)]